MSWQGVPETISALSSEEVSSRRVAIPPRGFFHEERPSSLERNASLWSRLVLRYVNEGILCMDAKGTCSYASSRACELLKRDAGWLLGKNLHNILHGEAHRSCDGASCAFVRQQETQQAQSKVHDRFFCAAGKKIPVDYIIDPLYNGGAYLGAVLVFQDATERLAIEAMRNEEERKLVERSQSLEEFTYQFAHDIKEPLRTLNYCCDFLREELSEERNAILSEIIDTMSSSSARLQRMIEDSLSYAVSRTQKLHTQTIVLNDCVAIVVAGLRLKIEECQGRVELGELPSVLGDESQVERIFQNLIQNALKFQGDETPEIRIFEVPCEKPGHVVIAVRDNGIGIEPEYHQRIFGTFQRLHSHLKYEGSGIGLAFVRKSLERQGGEVWVESQPGMGSTFFLQMKAA